MPGIPASHWDWLTVCLSEIIIYLGQLGQLVANETVCLAEFFPFFLGPSHVLIAIQIDIQCVSVKLIGLLDNLLSWEPL